MVRGTLSLGKTLIAAGIVTMAGCTSKPEELAPSTAAHHAALEKAKAIPSLPAGSETEKEALRRFEEFYAVYSAEAIKSQVREVYAENAWFGDPFHQVRGIDEIERYFVAMAEPVESCTFTVDSMQRVGDDFFARWTMRLVSKAAKGEEPIEAIGMSHVRYDAEGRIVFQQDYWDTSVMFDRLPVVGFWTRLVKDRIAKGMEE